MVVREGGWIIGRYKSYAVGTGSDCGCNLVKCNAAGTAGDRCA